MGISSHRYLLCFRYDCKKRDFRILGTYVPTDDAIDLCNTIMTSPHNLAVLLTSQMLLLNLCDFIHLRFYKYLAMRTKNTID